MSSFVTRCTPEPYIHLDVFYAVSANGRPFNIWSVGTGLSWDKEACKYKIAEPGESSGDLDDYAEYAFVVRNRMDRNSEEVTLYIDIKSEGLRDILRGVLNDIKAISLTEDKPMVIEIEYYTMKDCGQE